MAQMKNSFVPYGSQTQKIDMQLPRRRGEGREMDRELGVSRCTLVYTGCIYIKKVLLYSTGHFPISCDKPYWKRIFKKEYKCV